jgi:GT2 family glycosyltransferase
MDRAEPARELLEELAANKQAVRALEAERDAVARAPGPAGTRSGRHHWMEVIAGPESSDWARQRAWMDRLLGALKAEEQQVEQELRRRLETLPPPGSLESLPDFDGNRGYWRRLVRSSARAIRVLKTEGFEAFVVKTTRCVGRKLAAGLRSKSAAADALLESLPHLFRPSVEGRDPAYAEWIRRNEPTPAELVRQRRTVLPFQPLVSVIVPAYNTPVLYLLAMIESVRAQTYPHWQLCIADGASSTRLARQMLAYYARNDERIRVDFLPENLGIAGNSNRALALASGDYMALLDHDDTLAPFALFEIAAAVNRYPEADFLYSDEDTLAEHGRHRYSPHFKPAWGPDTLRTCNYVTHLSVFSRALMAKAGGFREGFEGSQDYDLILRATEQARQIVHIPKVLYHWRSHARSTACTMAAKPYAIEAGRKALAEHLARCGLNGRVRAIGATGLYRVLYRLPRRPLVSIVVPGKDRVEDLRHCLESIADSTYSNYEVVIVDNESAGPETRAYGAELARRPEVRIASWNGPFHYAAATNFGVRQSRGEVLLLLDSDMEVINRDWMESLLEHALRPEVGAVGAKLYYPNGAIRHGGGCVGLTGFAGHLGRHRDGRDDGYQQLLRRVQNLSAVTGACLMTRRSIYEEVGGLDEDFDMDFSDVDWCMKVRQRGYLIVWTPYAELYHFESQTHGRAEAALRKARYEAESRRFARKWREVLEAGDPYYNPNLTLNAHDWGIRAAGACPQLPRAVVSGAVRRTAA